jgi:polysaccharide export outer membrane protein
MQRHLLQAFCLLVLLSSCIQNRKILYLQKGDVNKKDLPKDSVVRKYTIEDFDYRVQVNDIISVRYYSLTDKEFDVLNQQSQPGITGGNMMIGGALLFGELVDSKGEIPMPVVGKVKVEGLTVFQIQDTLQQLANIYLEKPIVKVRLLNYRATVLGAVNAEGLITFNNNRVSLLEAIGLAGGLDDLADRSNIKVVRQQGSKAEVHYVNILSEDFIHSPFYYVHQNDVIIIPPLRQRPYRKYFGQNISLVISSISLLLLVITLNKK